MSIASIATARIRARTVARRVTAAVRRGDYAVACEAATAALPELERWLGEREPDLGELFNVLGVAAKHAGKYEDAERWYERALAIALACVGHRSVAVATLWHNIGGLWHARGRPDLGEPFARGSVELRTALLGDDHPTVATDLAAHATILDDLGRLDDAQRAFERALAIFANAYGEQHVEVGHTLGGLGAMFAGARRWVEARDALARARTILIAALGPGHPEVARIDHYQAVAAYGAGDRVMALACSARALAVCERRLAHDHPLTEDVRATCNAIAARESTNQID